jgi:ABC-2 type transport system permease protein
MRRSARHVVARRVAAQSARTGALWGAVYALIVVSSVTSYASAYPTAAKRAEFARTLGANAGLQALLGVPHRIDTLAGFVVWRALGILALVGGVWGLLLATKVLRGEEDAGRWELLLSGRTTRGRAAAEAVAGLAAGVIVAFFVTGLGTVAIGRTHDAQFSVSSSVFFAAALVAPAAMFAAVGVLCSQLAATRRQASGLAAIVLGIAFMLRAVADSGHSLRWLRWASPLGWVEALEPLTHSQPLVLVLILVVTVAVAASAVVLAGARDLGGSTLPDRDTARARTRLLNGPFGLSVRLFRPSAIGWTAAAAVGAFFFGLVARAAGESIAKSNTVAQLLQRLGGRGTGAALYLGIAFLMIGTLVTLQAAGQVAATRDEEAQGYLDNLLVRRVGRVRWFTSRLTVGAAALVMVALAAGVAAWIGGTTQHADVAFTRLLDAGVNIVPAGLFVLGVGTLAHALVPRVASIAAYTVVAWSFLIQLIGSVVKIGNWLLDTSLFHHVALAPAADPNWTSATVLALIGFSTAAIGVAVFARRDLVTA